MGKTQKERKLVLVDGLVAEFGGFLVEIYEDMLMSALEDRFVATVRRQGEAEVHVMLETEGLREHAEVLIGMIKFGEFDERKLMYDIECILGVQENGGHLDKFGKYTPEVS